MTRWRGRRILVTGAAGFIGANLVEALVSAGAEVHALVRASTDRSRLDALGGPFSIPVADLTDLAATRSVVRAVRPHIVFHAAASGGHHETPAAYSAVLADTLLSTSNLCHAVRDLDLHRFIHFGSSLEYGPATEPLSETREPAPTTGRGAVKAAETLWCRRFAQASGLPLVVLRPFSVYGPWESAPRFVPTVMTALLTGGELRLTRPGIRRDFVFVGDVVQASLRAALAPGVVGEIINVGSGRQWTNEALVELAERVAGVTIRAVPSAYDTRPVDTEYWVADVSKARDVLGWSAAHQLEQGLAETYHWFAARNGAPSRVDVRGAAR
jgi:nucleoside-diphosphate-sugar epimerase